MLGRSRFPILRLIESTFIARRCKGGVYPMKLYSLRRRIAEKLSNKYHEEKVNVLGPELACLEWLMECGCTEVTMSDGTKITSIREMKEFIPHAKSIPNTGHGSIIDIAYEEKWKHIPRIHLVKVDASDSAIANEGFKYFRDLKRLEALKLNFCDYFDDDALRELALGRPATTLKNIEIVLNPAVSDASVYWLSRLKSLRTAHFYFLPYVSNRQGFLRQLKLALPKCKVTFPEVGVIGYGYAEDQQK